MCGMCAMCGMCSGAMCAMCAMCGITWESTEATSQLCMDFVCEYQLVRGQNRACKSSVH